MQALRGLFLLDLNKNIASALKFSFNFQLCWSYEYEMWYADHAHPRMVFL
jgi:hypothetical protein